MFKNRSLFRPEISLKHLSGTEESRPCQPLGDSGRGEGGMSWGAHYTDENSLAHDTGQMVRETWETRGSRK